MFVSEAYINATEGYRFGESEVYDTSIDSSGDVYRMMQREYGRCVGKVFIDLDGKTKHIGWTFQGRVKYEDSNETYLRETWVTLHDAPDTVTRTPHYHEL